MAANACVNKNGKFNRRMREEKCFLILKEFRSVRVNKKK